MHRVKSTGSAPNPAWNRGKYYASDIIYQCCSDDPEKEEIKVRKLCPKCKRFLNGRNNGFCNPCGNFESRKAMRTIDPFDIPPHRNYVIKGLREFRARVEKEEKEIILEAMGAFI